MRTLRFETLEEAYLPAILDIEARSNPSPWSERSFRNELNHEHGIFLAAIANGSVIGYGGIWLVVDEAHVTNVAVSPEHRRQGIGRRLMIELLERAKTAGMTCSTLEVRVSNEPAIKLYEDLGYLRTSLRRNYYPDNREDAVVMWLHQLDQWEPPRG